MENIKISICVPIYGVEQFIERCVKSLFEQTYTNIEYIFVNDCTPDKSMIILNQMLTAYPSRANQTVIVTHETNKGLAAARNTAVAHCTGQFLVWVDSDDYIELDAIEKLVKKQSEADYDIVSFDATVLKKGYKDSLIHKDVSTGEELSLMLLSRKTPVCACTRLIRVSLYKNNGIRAIEGINNSEDYQVTPRLAYYANRVGVLHERLYNYDCRNEDSYTATFSEKNALQTWSALEELSKFFKDEQKLYKESLQIGQINIITRQLINSCKDTIHASYFALLHERLKRIDRKYWCEIDSLRRVCLYIKSPVLLHGYLKIMRNSKKYLNGIKQLLH